MNTEQETNKATIRIYIDGKEMLYSHQNIVANDDLDEMKKTCHKLKDHRNQKEYLAKLETLKHSWPYPDTKQQLEND